MSITEDLQRRVFSQTDLEMVARSLCEANGENPDARVILGEPMRSKFGRPIISVASFPIWTDYIDMAAGVLRRQTT